jgi:hypothetical protein
MVTILFTNAAAVCQAYATAYARGNPIGRQSHRDVNTSAGLAPARIGSGWPARLLVGVRKPDLFGRRLRSRLPIAGAFHDLAHVLKPPEGAVEVALAAGTGKPGDRPRLEAGSVETQFELGTGGR